MDVPEQQKQRRFHRNNFIHIPYKKIELFSRKKDSCIVKSENDMDIALRLKYIGNVTVGLKETLDKFLFSYSEKLGGVLLGFNQIKIKESRIIDDQEFISIKIIANFLTFKPKIGNRVYGKVNKIGVHHYGCIIHGCINGSVRQPKKKDITAEQNKLLEKVEVGDIILFTIKKLEIHHEVMVVLGDVHLSFYDKLRKKKFTTTRSNVTCDTEQTYKNDLNIDVNHNVNSQDIPVTKNLIDPSNIKKELSSKLRINGDDEHITHDEIKSEDKSPKKKKKKRKSTLENEYETSKLSERKKKKK